MIHQTGRSEILLTALISRQELQFRIEKFLEYRIMKARFGCWEAIALRLKAIALRLEAIALLGWRPLLLVPS